MLMTLAQRCAATGESPSITLFTRQLTSVTLKSHAPHGEKETSIGYLRYKVLCRTHSFAYIIKYDLKIELFLSFSYAMLLDMPML